MNKYFFSFLLVILGGTLLLSSEQAKAQEFKDAVSYMQYIGTEHKAIAESMMSYTSAAAHSKSAKKIEKRRQKLLETTLKAQQTVQEMPSFEGDVTYRNAVVEYLRLNYAVLKDEYAKVVDLEEIAEQSYDLMEAYLMTKEKANEKVDLAKEKLDEQAEVFATSHNIRLLENESELSKKIKEANRVTGYYNELYLVFFKSYKDESYVLNALDKNDINALEQSKNTLLKSSNEGLGKLTKIEALNDDKSLIEAAQKILLFYQDEAEEKFPLFTDYYLKKENVNKAKATFEKIKAKDRTQADIDAYNKAIDDFNLAVNAFNDTGKALNEQRITMLEDWEKAANKFLDKHIPKYNK